MKFSLLLTLLAMLSFQSLYAQSVEPQNLSIIKSIDNVDLPYSASEASEEALPYDELSKLLDYFDFTVLSEARVQELFTELETNPNARYKYAGGYCATRRYYIQNYFKKIGIKSGSLLIECPFNNGVLRLVDQVTGKRMTFSNFHDANIVSVADGYNVLDLQFENGPRTLSAYLAEVEASQKLKPMKERSSSDRGYCYWSIKP
jgi:hypothetical protein